jgi:hypothetical protein
MIKFSDKKAIEIVCTTCMAMYTIGLVFNPMIVLIGVVYNETKGVCLLYLYVQ